MNEEHTPEEIEKENSVSLVSKYKIKEKYNNELNNSPQHHNQDLQDNISVKTSEHDPVGDDPLGNITINSQRNENLKSPNAKSADYKNKSQNDMSTIQVEHKPILPHNSVNIDVDQNDKTCCKKFLETLSNNKHKLVCGGPFDCIRYYTIFPNREENLESNFVCMYPMTSSIAAVILTGNIAQSAFGIPLITFVFGCSIIACILYYITYKCIGKKILYVNIPFSLIMILLWLNASADQIVESIVFLSDHHNVNMVLLAATLIAIGNSLQDYFANSGMSGLGYGIMAVSGTMGGQLFNFLIGFG